MATTGLPEGVPYRLSAVDYFRMVDADIIPSDRPVGPWKGLLYEKMPKTCGFAVPAGATQQRQSSQRPNRRNVGHVVRDESQLRHNSAVDPGCVTRIPACDLAIKPGIEFLQLLRDRFHLLLGGQGGNGLHPLLEGRVVQR